MNPILLVLLAVGGYLFYEAKKTAQNLKYTINSVSLNPSSTISQLNGVINIQIFNSFNFGISLIQFTGQLFYKNILIGNFYFNNTMSINPGVNNIQVPVSIPTGSAGVGIYLILKDLFQKKETPQFLIVGSMNFNPVGKISINSKGNFLVSNV